MDGVCMAVLRMQQEVHQSVEENRSLDGVCGCLGMQQEIHRDVDESTRRRGFDGSRIFSL